jgi:integrase
MELFIQEKTQSNCRSSYIQGCLNTYLKPLSKAFPGKLVTDLTTSEAEKYVFSKTTWNPTTKASHIGYLRTFYEFLIKQGYTKLNPFKNLAKPRPQNVATKILSPHDVKKMLQLALNEGRKAECAAMTIVFFCGVRVDEAGRLNWDQVDLWQGRIKIESENAKKRRRRVNVISPNALEWLKVCQSTGRIAPNDYAQRMKRFRIRTGVAYAQNAMRHCFATYHMAKHEDSAKTAAMLSHSNPSMLYGTYYDVASKEEAEEFWDIIPDSVVAQRQQEAKRADDIEHADALCRSNCGKAIKDESGNWHPVQYDPCLDEGVGN